MWIKLRIKTDSQKNVNQIKIKTDSQKNVNQIKSISLHNKEYGMWILQKKV